MSGRYKELIAEVDQNASMIADRYRDHLHCHSGCSSCCQHHLSVFPVEAAEMASAVRALSPALRSRLERQAKDVVQREAQQQPVACPLLVDERCSIYEQRPVICRTQGLPLLLKADDGVDEVDWCPLNFTAPGAVNDLDEEHLVQIEPLNVRLALVNIGYIRESDPSKRKPGDRTSVADIILELSHLSEDD